MRKRVAMVAHVRAEIGEVLVGKARDGEDRQMITIYNLRGRVAEDLAVARAVQELGAQSSRTIWLTR